MAVESWEEFFVDYPPVDGCFEEGAGEGLVMGHFVLLHVFSKFVDGGLGDAAVRGQFCVWDGVSEVGR